MSSPKAHCLDCGAELLQATANVTGGFCMRCVSTREQNKKPPPPPPVEWRAVLGCVQNRDTLFSNGGRCTEWSYDALPPAIARWKGAYELMIELANGWSDVAWQYLRDLALGVAGFEEIGYSHGAESGKEVIDILRQFGLQADSVTLEEDILDLDDSQREEMEEAIKQLDARWMKQVWGTFDQLEQKLIAKAQELVRDQALP